MKNRYEIRDEVTAIFIQHKGKTMETLIDTNDLEKVNEFPNTWCIAKQRNTLYVYGWMKIKDKQTTIKLHRFLLSVDKNLIVDHIDRNGLNNVRSNLRIVTNAENMQNVTAYKTSKSGIRGVSWYEPSKKWRAKLQVNGKHILVGYFDDIKQAEQAVKEARAKYMPYSQEAIKTL